MSTYSIPDDSCAGRILLAFSSVMIEARVQLEAGWRQAGWIVDWCEGQHALARLLAMHPPDAVALCGVAGTLSGLVRTTRTSVPAAVVVALLSEGGLPERIAMMRAGVDLCWPIETQVEEVAAMVDAFARRGTASAAAASAWYLSNAGRVLAGPGGVRLPLTVAEREFMARLLAAPGHRLARQQLACGFRQRGVQDGAPVSSRCCLRGRPILRMPRRMTRPRACRATSTSWSRVCAPRRSAWASICPCCRCAAGVPVHRRQRRGLTCCAKPPLVLPDKQSGASGAHGTGLHLARHGRSGIQDKSEGLVRHVGWCCRTVQRLR